MINNHHCHFSHYHHLLSHFLCRHYQNKNLVPFTWPNDLRVRIFLQGSACHAVLATYTGIEAKIGATGNITIFEKISRIKMFLFIDNLLTTSWYIIHISSQNKLYLDCYTYCEPSLQIMPLEVKNVESQILMEYRQAMASIQLVNWQ